MEWDALSLEGGSPAEAVGRQANEKELRTAQLREEVEAPKKELRAGSIPKVCSKSRCTCQ